MSQQYSQREPEHVIYEIRGSAEAEKVAGGMFTFLKIIMPIMLLFIVGVLILVGVFFFKFFDIFNSFFPK